MVDRRVLAVLFFLTTACSAADFPSRYHDLLALFGESRPHLIAIEQELEKDGLWQLVPHYVDGSINKPHVPSLTANQIDKYRKLLELVPYVRYVDKEEDRTDFSLGTDAIDRRIFSYQFIHTTRRPRPTNCDEVSMAGARGVCSSDLGDDWSLWVTWFVPSDGAKE
jgi:hypothetical protein